MTSTPFDPSGWECQHLISRFFNSLDERRFQDLTSLMTPEGCWVRLGVELKGSAAILKAMEGRSVTVQTRHLVSNYEFERTGRQTARSRCCVTVYRIETGQPASSASPSIFVFEDEYKLLDRRWQIDLHRGQSAFATTS